MHYDHDLHMKFSRYVDFGYFDECWAWKGAVARSVRGPQHSWGVVRAFGKTMKASRISWFLNAGEIPAGMNVCHQCDNPLCVNPRHLFLGTQAQNVADMDAKGRRRSAPVQGVAHHNAKLTTQQVSAIRQRREVSRVLSAEFGVSETTINKIRRGAARRNG